MAVASENLLRVTQWQINWSVGEFVLLLLTLGAAYGALYVSWRTARRQLRAYVCVMGGITGKAGGTEQQGAQFHIANCGATPAYNVSYWSNLEIGPVDFEGEFEKGGGSSRIGVLPPRAENTNFTANDPGKVFAPEDLADVIAGRKSLYVYGEISYADCFGERHKTRFRLWYGKGTGAPKQNALWFCRDGNEAS